MTPNLGPGELQEKFKERGEEKCFGEEMGIGNQIFNV